MAAALNSKSLYVHTSAAEVAAALNADFESVLVVKKVCVDMHRAQID